MDSGRSRRTGSRSSMGRTDSRRRGRGRRRFRFPRSRDSDGRCVEFCGEFETREKALAHAETTPPGTPESDWESERKAGGQAALLAPSLDGKEDEEPLGWFGDGGWHVVVRVVYPAV